MEKSILQAIEDTYETTQDPRFVIPEFSLNRVYTHRAETQFGMNPNLTTPTGLCHVEFSFDEEPLSLPETRRYQALEQLAQQIVTAVPDSDQRQSRLTMSVFKDPVHAFFFWANPQHYSSENPYYWVLANIRRESNPYRWQNFPSAKLHFNESLNSCKDHTIALIIHYLIERQQSTLKTMSEGFVRFVFDSLRPLSEYLDAEREAILDERFKPKCRYTKLPYLEGGQGDKITDQGKKDTPNAFFELDDPPRAFTESGNWVEVLIDDPTKKTDARLFRAKILDFDFDDMTLMLPADMVENWPDSGTLAVQGDLNSNRRKQNAIKQLKTGNRVYLQRLCDAIVRPAAFPPVQTYPVVPDNAMFDRDNKESQSQCAAIDLAVSTPDFAIIQGPPGTGKTEVICEIIRQTIKRNGRVLLAAPAHVAVDNVLERLADEEGINPIRIGRPRRVAPELRKYLLDSQRREWDDALVQLRASVTVNGPEISEARNGPPLQELQYEFFESLQKEEPFHIRQLIVDQANLVCGTSIGIANFSFSRATEEVPFDLLIVDESSKATLLEFLVPAVRSRRWILVGDHRQLAPYVNDFELKVYLQRFIESSTQQGQHNPNGRSMVSRRRQNSQRIKEDQLTREYESQKRRVEFDPKVDEIMRYIRRYHEEEHRLEQTSDHSRFYLERLVQSLKYQKKSVLALTEMVEYALGSCFHYFHKRVDDSRKRNLPVQHRMPREIADFLNQEIYEGEFKTAKDALSHGLRLPLNSKRFTRSWIKTPLCWISTSRTSDPQEKEKRYRQRGWIYNPTEVQVIGNLVDSLIKGYPFRFLKKRDRRYYQRFNTANPFTIGIITYYGIQAEEVRKVLQQSPQLEQGEFKWQFRAKTKPIRVRVSVVDRFQGQEQEIIILSTTRSNRGYYIGFLKNLQRVNVSLSRARENLLIVGDHSFYSSLWDRPGNKLLRSLALLCERRGWVIEYRVPKIVDNAKSKAKKTLKPSEPQYEENSAKKERINSSKTKNRGK